MRDHPAGCRSRALAARPGLAAKLPRALVLDFDGTLTDSIVEAEPWRAAHDRLFSQFTGLSPERVAQLCGAAAEASVRQDAGAG